MDKEFEELVLAVAAAEDARDAARAHYQEAEAALSDMNMRLGNAQIELGRWQRAQVAKARGR